MRSAYVFLLLLPFSAALADDDITPFMQADYFAPSSLPATLLPPPPAMYTQEWNDEITQMIVMQKSVTDYDREEITAELHIGPEVFSAAAENWDAQHYPATFHLLDKSLHSCMDVTEQDKAFWNTKRPYLSDPRIRSLAGEINNGSYPSGHTACSLVMAEVLGQILPAKLGLLRDRAEQIAQHRILAGVHFPHDIKGGEQLSMIIMGALEQSPEFQHDMQAAAKEFGHTL